MPNQDESTLRSAAWSIVSNAAVKIQDDTPDRLEVNLQKKLSISVPDQRDNLVGNVT